MIISERDMLRKIASRLKNKFGVKVDRKELSSTEDCYRAIEKVVAEANRDKINETLLKLCEDYRKLNFSLKLEIAKLKAENKILAQPKISFIKKLLGVLK